MNLESIKIKIRNNDSFFCVLVVFFIAFTILAYFEPRTLDDWTWGGKVGLERLKNQFADYNGRYLGNIIVIIMTRLPRILCALCQSVLMSGILYLIYKLVNKNIIAFITVIGIMVLLPLNMLKQTYVWVSGYAVYVVSAFSVLCFICFLSETYKKRRNSKLLHLFIIFCLSITAQLIVENATFFFTVSLFCVNILYFIQNKRINNCLITSFLGSAFGMFIMFSNGAYHAASIGNKEITYKEIEKFSFNPEWFAQVWDTYATQTIPAWFLNNIVLNFLLCAIMIFYCYKASIKFQRICITFYVASCGYFIFYHFNGNWTYYFPVFKHIQAIWITVFCISMLATVLKTVKNKEDKFPLGLTLFAQIPLMMPLIITAPINARCFLATYVLFAVFIGKMISYMQKNSWLEIKNFYQWEKNLIKILNINIIVVFGLYAIIYGFISNKAQERVDYIHQQVNKGEKIVDIFYIPHSDGYSLGMNPNLEDEYWIENYKSYYGIPRKIKFNYSIYPEWKEKIEGENK